MIRVVAADTDFPVLTNINALFATGGNHMRLRVVLVLALAVSGSAGLAKDVYLPIAGSPGNFKTDVRLLNTSANKDIVVNATFLPVGQDNNAATSIVINVPKRTMVTRDDAVRTMFGITNPGALGAIKLTSDDNFVASMRIYAVTEEGTLGQFAPGIEPTEAKTKGILMQLRANGSFGMDNTFRTNLGFMNPNASAAQVTVTLYDKNNLVVGTPFSVSVPPRSVEFPRSAESPLRLSSTAADFSEAWVSFDSTQPVIGFASVVDNGTSDPFFQLAFVDMPTAGNQATKTFHVTARSGFFDVREGSMRVQQGDHVIVYITAVDALRGLALERYAPRGVRAFPGQTKTIEFDATVAGTFAYYSTRSDSGTSQFSVMDELVVEPRE
jgi:hypothetical protein